MNTKKTTGHRGRLRERFIKAEIGSRSDEALLELILTYAIPRKDVKPIAEKLVERFGSLSRVLAASVENLMEVHGSQ